MISVSLSLKDEPVSWYRSNRKDITGDSIS